MKKWITSLLIFSTINLSANESIPQTKKDKAIDPINSPSPKKKPSAKMMRNKHVAAVIIGTAATIIIGLLVSGNQTGKPAPSSPTPDK